MKRFIQGEHRTQNTLFPETLDDYVTECSPVRVVEVFVEGLDLGILGFEGVKLEVNLRGRMCGRQETNPIDALFYGNYFSPNPYNLIAQAHKAFYPSGTHKNCRLIPG
jgi:hypothetical protein